MPRKHYTNEYFLDFCVGPLARTPRTPEVHNDKIPVGFHVFHYKDLYIPTGAHYGTFSRGAGMNAETMDVPIYYMDTPEGLRRAIQCCIDSDVIDKQRAVQDAANPRLLRLHATREQS